MLEWWHKRIAKYLALNLFTPSPDHQNSQCIVTIEIIYSFMRTFIVHQLFQCSNLMSKKCSKFAFQMGLIPRTGSSLPWCVSILFFDFRILSEKYFGSCFLTKSIAFHLFLCLFTRNKVRFVFRFALVTHSFGACLADAFSGSASSEPIWWLSSSLKSLGRSLWNQTFAPKGAKRRQKAPKGTQVYLPLNFVRHWRLMRDRYF